MSIYQVIFCLNLACMADILRDTKPCPARNDAERWAIENGLADYVDGILKGTSKARAYAEHIKSQPLPTMTFTTTGVSTETGELSR